MKRLLPILLLPCLAAAGPMPLSDLHNFNASIAALHQIYKQQVPALTKYAEQQDFQHPYEKLAIVSHELIHIASAANVGYWSNGQILAGYEPAYWVGLKNRQIQPTADEQGQLAAVWEGYVKRTPNNTLGNVLDEINAYSSTVGFVCKHAPQDAVRQIAPLMGHLTLMNAYLRNYRLVLPNRYSQLQQNLVIKSIIESMATQGWKALANCKIDRIDHQEEVLRFLNARIR
ncbi:hypothetical protein ACFFU8_09585 [Chromobacterium piscinae]|uniref:hypothetical protein n=1 Tax=Chromobacterium piscinae TaxID=686831 RepID=UPI001E5A16F2|nr:hypothetical protein [Chromobacterium piscinae]MCD5327844.1 hypothetical protein [Chromobacterium piscinae]